MEERIENITKMENILNHTNVLISEMENLLDNWKKNQAEFNALMNYYGSPEWHQDREDDEHRRLPVDLPRGVLSEDSVHNTYGERKEILIKMIRVAVAGLE